MRSGPRLSLATLLALSAIAGVPVAMAEPRRGQERGYTPSKPSRETELQREIADHNAAVEAKKAERRVRRRSAPKERA